MALVGAVRYKLVQWVLRRGPSCSGSRCGDIALRSRHRFVTKQLHQRVDAGVGAGEFSGVSVAQPVHKSAGHRLGVGSGAFERSLDPRLQGSLSDAFAVATDEKWGMCRSLG